MPIGRSPRTDVLLKAEKVVLEFGGVVLRLAGLYISFMKVELRKIICAVEESFHRFGCILVFFIFESDLNYAYKSDRGAHVYWLHKGIVETRPDHILNLIHYEVTESSYCTRVYDKLFNIVLLISIPFFHYI